MGIGQLYFKIRMAHGSINIIVVSAFCCFGLDGVWGHLSSSFELVEYFKRHQIAKYYLLIHT